MTEGDLMRTRLSNRDAAAFEDAYRNLFPCIRGFLRICLGRQDASDDLAQETFLQLWQQPDRFDPGRSNLKAYLLGIARHKAADWWRRSGTQRTQPEPVVTIEPEAAPAIQQLLDRLPSDLRTILWLREAEGYSYEELARLLEIPIGTVKSRLSAAREELRSLWNKNNPPNNNQKGL